ncbi:hypothetical protein M8C21_031989, partial [Ambrosia artemisiifolia]
THTKESSSVDYLIAKTSSDFWSNLVKHNQDSPKRHCSRLSPKVQKSTRKGFEGENQNDTTPPTYVRSKVKSKRKVLDKVGRKRAGTRKPLRSRQSCENITEGSSHQGETQRESLSLNPRTSEGQQSQDDQLQPHTSSSTPLETEIERIQKEREQITKSYQEKKSMLLVECEKEMLEVQKKYDVLIHASETSLTKEIKILDDYQKLVDANKLLAKILAQNWQDKLNLKRPELNLKRADKGASRATTAEIPQIPTSALVRPKNPCLTGGSTTNLPGLRAPAPHLRSSLPMFASFHNQPNAGEPSLEPLPALSTIQTVNEHY